MHPASESLPTMSAATKEILSRVKMMVPPMLDKFHKGAFCARGWGGRNWREENAGGRAHALWISRTAGPRRRHRRQRGLHGRAVLFGHGERAVGL